VNAASAKAVGGIHPVARTENPTRFDEDSYLSGISADLDVAAAGPGRVTGDAAPYRCARTRM
jgi:hypothetical protein